MFEDAEDSGDERPATKTRKTASGRVLMRRCDPRPRTRKGHAHRPYEHTRLASTRSAPPCGADGAPAWREPIPEQTSTPAQVLSVPGRRPPQDAPPLVQPCWRAGRPRSRTGHAPVPARALSWDTGSATLERKASQHGASPYRPEQNVVPAHNPVRVLGRRACQDTPSPVLPRGASQDGRSPVPARNRVLGHRSAVLERPATWNMLPVVPERRAVPAWVGGVPGRGGQSATD